MDKLLLCKCSVLKCVLSVEPFDLACERECASRIMNLEEVVCMLKYQPEQWWKSSLCFGRQPTRWYGNLKGVSQFNGCAWHCTLQGRTWWFGYVTDDSFLIADLYADTPFVLDFSLNAMTDQEEEEDLWHHMCSSFCWIWLCSRTQPTKS